MAKEIIRRAGITRTAAAAAVASLSLAITSAAIGLAAVLGPSEWLYLLRLWTPLLVMCIGVIVVASIVHLGVWLIWDRKGKPGIAINGLVFIGSIMLPAGALLANQWLDNEAQAAQLDIVEEICRQGFENPATLEAYKGEGAAIGRWADAFLWEDESRNAIWVDSCDSLSACGIVCIRDGVLLENATRNYEYHEFKYIRDSLYWWD